MSTVDELTPNANPSSERVQHAALSMRTSAVTRAIATAARHAKQRDAVDQASMMSSAYVSSAASRSRSTSTAKPSAVGVGVAHICAIESAPRQPVYDLTIEGQPEFFAELILVHNCIDAAGYLVWGIPTWRASLPQGNSLTYSTYV